MGHNRAFVRAKARMKRAKREQERLATKKEGQAAPAKKPATEKS
jgi:hypothetical protein